MSLFKISEKIVLNKLKKIEYGSLKLINYDGQVFHFGNLEDELTADIKIKNEKFYEGKILNDDGALTLLVTIDKNVLNSESRNKLMDDLIEKKGRTE